jgi:hypothetical protein
MDVCISTSHLLCFVVTLDLIGPRGGFLFSGWILRVLLLLSLLLLLVLVFLSGGIVLLRD